TLPGSVRVLQPGNLAGVAGANPARRDQRVSQQGVAEDVSDAWRGRQGRLRRGQDPEQLGGTTLAVAAPGGNPAPGSRQTDAADDQHVACERAGRLGGTVRGAVRGSEQACCSNPRYGGAGGLGDEPAPAGNADFTPPGHHRFVEVTCPRWLS